MQSGLWGVSRHINYVGEVVQAVAVALPSVLLTGRWGSFAYPLYYVALFLGRQADDDAIGLAKYGAAWVAYEAAVPWRFIPGVW